jgi:hypothetical protein
MVSLAATRRVAAPAHRQAAELQPADSVPQRALLAVMVLLAATGRVAAPSLATMMGMTALVVREALWTFARAQDIQPPQESPAPQRNSLIG